MPTACEYSTRNLARNKKVRIRHHDNGAVRRIAKAFYPEGLSMQTRVILSHNLYAHTLTWGICLKLFCSHGNLSSCRNKPFVVNGQIDGSSAQARIRAR